MDGTVLAMIFLGVVLKVPVAFAVWLIWWAWRAEPDPVEGEGGSGDTGFRRHRRQPKRPRGPRRGGPHPPEALPLPCPPGGGRTRVLSPPAPLRAGHGSSGRGRIETRR